LRDVAIVNGTVITELGLIRNGNILVESGKITRITQSPISGVSSQIDATGNYVSPGFVDLHIHGFGGYDATRGDDHSLVGMSSALVKHGTTGFLPTLVSMPIAQTRTFLESVKKCMPHYFGARILGAHLEGPFLNVAKRGVHREEYLMRPSVKLLDELTRGFEGVVRILTLAPELDRGLELCRQVVEMGIIAAIGHTTATFEQANKGIEAGITHSTHTFNGMPSLEGREPGAVGAVLLSDAVKAEIIADGLHLSPAMTKLAIRTKRSDGLILVTDAVMPAGTDVGEFELAGVRAYVHDGGSFTKDGRLCGSILTLERALKNIVTWNDLPLPEAVRLVSLNPAKQVGISSTTGSLAEGKDADIVIMDRDFRVISTFVQGEQAYP
jgi:N-acetylglucosamine-6-phosphate deacetylase